MIPTHEQTYPLSPIRKYIHDRTGRRVSSCSLWRWAVHGLNGVKLGHIRVGRQIQTSYEAVDRFFRELALSHLSPTSDAIAGAFESWRHAAAERALDDVGL